MSPENRNKATACMCIDYTHVTWLLQVHMQVEKLLKHKNERILFRCFSGWELAFFFFFLDCKPIEGSSRDRTSASDQVENKQRWWEELQLRNARVAPLILCRGGSTLTTFCSCLMSLCNPVLPDFVTPLLGSKSHLAAARKNRNYPLNPPPSKQQSSLSIQQLNTSSLS